MSVNKELLNIFGYCAHNLAWLKTKRIILICEVCCSQLRETYQFLKMWHKNSAQLQVYMDQLNTENEAEQLVHLEDIHQVKCDIKDEEIYADEYEPILEETQDVFVNIEDSLLIEEDTWKKEETDAKVKCEIKDEEVFTDENERIIEETQDVFVNIEDSLITEEDTLKMEETDEREEYPIDNNSTETMNNESDSEISVNSNTHITDTGRVSSGFTCKQVPATNKTDSNTLTSKPYPCAACRKSFTRKTTLKKHMRIHTDGIPFKCARCDGFSSKQAPATNKEDSNTPANKPYTCATCSASFTRKTKLKSHMRIHTSGKPYKCATCGGLTSKQAPAINKEDSNTPASKPYTCSTCSKSFTRKTNLMGHIRIHTGEKPYKCDKCDKCFRTNRHLVYHMRIHTGEKPYQCGRCEKCFITKGILLHHMRIHTGEKPYKCNKCDKCFSQQSGLMYHMRIHTGEKPYQCERCEKCFITKGNLLNHMRKHTGEKPYKCDKCDKCFWQQSSLVCHMRRHTGEKPYQCASCDKGFITKSNLVNHMRKHHIKVISVTNILDKNHI